MADFLTPYATRLCLSGVESRRLLDTFKQFGVPHIQVSYYYLRKVFNDPLEFQEYSKGFKTVIIDSGTVYGNVKNEDQKKELIQDYVSYLAALDKSAYTAAVYEGGVNIERVVPDEALIYPLDMVRDTFDNDMRAIMKELKYVGVSNKEASAKGGENLPPIFTHAAREGTYIHAFGTSSKKLLSKYPFYSANSSSWRSGSRYLNTYLYEGPSRGLRLYQPTDKSDPVKTEKENTIWRRRQKNLTTIRQADIGGLISWDDLIMGDSWEVDKGNLAQWLLYQQDLSLLPQNKYYLTDKERQDIIARKKDLLANMHGGADKDSRGEEESTHRESRREEEEEKEGLGIGPPDIEDPPYIEGDAIEIEGYSIPRTENTPDAVYPSTENTGPTPAELVENVSSQLAPADISARITPVDDRLKTLRECDFCILAGRCPKYEEGAKCAYGYSDIGGVYNPQNLEAHIMEDAADLLYIEKDRILQAYLEEKTDASGLNKDLTTNIKIYMEMVQLLSEATDKRDEVSIKAKGAGVLDIFKKK